jgi:hypothetical protein
MRSHAELGGGATVGSLLGGVGGGGGIVLLVGVLMTMTMSIATMTTRWRRGSKMG